MSMMGLLRKSPLTHLATLGTLYRSAGEGGPSAKVWVGEGDPEGRR